MNDERDRSDSKTTRNKLLKWIWKIIPTLLLSLFLIVVVSVIAKKIVDESNRLEAEKMAERRREPPPVNIVVQKIAPETIRDRVNLPGIVEPWIRLELLSEIRGRVVAVPVKEGEKVKQGEVLVHVDSRDYEIALDSARAEYNLALSDLNRARILFKRELLTPAEIDAVETKVLTLKAAVKNAELQLERSTIKAPISGVINRLDAKIGLLLSPADPVAEILQIDRIKAAIGIPESDVSAVRKLSRVDITIEALDGKTFSGKKYFLASSPDTLAHLYRMELALDNQTGEILPGMFVRAEIVKSIMTNSIVIPLYAVISRRDESLVYVEEEGKAKIRPVKLGILDGWRIQVLEGLKSGDRVIVVGHRDVDDGQKIKVLSVIADSRGLAK